MIRVDGFFESTKINSVVFLKKDLQIVSGVYLLYQRTRIERNNVVMEFLPIVDFGCMNIKLSAELVIIDDFIIVSNVTNLTLNPTNGSSSREIRLLLIL